MPFDEYDQEQHFRAAWNAITIERPVLSSLFTFGESVLPYFLILNAAKQGDPVSITKGEVKVDRPTIITPDTSRPEFRNFFENSDDEGYVQFLLARTAAFSHLNFDNRSGPARVVSDSVQEAVARLNRQLDAEDEEDVAILSAPQELAGMAVLRYAAERVMASGPDNLQELRERGFLP